MALFRDVVERLELLNRKTKIYQKLSAHLSLLVDQAMPHDDLPTGTDSTDAQRVLKELTAIIENMQAEREGYLAMETDEVEVPEADAMVFHFPCAESSQKGRRKVKSS